jgi:ribosomal protein S18 acetylase RimI-like enzyme
MISEVYAGHIDARINDQYRSVAGARKFLYNIVQYPGCGTFQIGASLVALDRQTRALCGVCLASLVGERAGHITQLCVAPRMQGRGLGRALMVRCLRAMREQGCRGASLTVTSSNGEALRLYLRAGFVSVRRFPACVWEAAPGPSRLA